MYAELVKFIRKRHLNSGRIESSDDSALLRYVTVHRGIGSEQRLRSRHRVTAQLEANEPAPFRKYETDTRNSAAGRMKPSVKLVFA